MFKAIIFGAFIVGAIFLIRFTPVKNYLTAEALGLFLETAGLWAPVVYMAIYAVGVCLFLPGTLLTGLGAAIFGAYWGFLYVWIGAMMGASAAFFIGRTLGREFAATLIGDKLKKYDDAIERNGFATVLYLRLVYFPFTPMNFGMGLTKVRFDQGPIPGLYCRNRSGYYRRHVYLHIFYRNIKRCMGLRQLGRADIF